MVSRLGERTRPEQSTQPFDQHPIPATFHTGSCEQLARQHWIRCENALHSPWLYVLLERHFYDLHHWAGSKSKYSCCGDRPSC